MTDELPALWALDKAAKNGGWEGWEHFRRVWALNKAGPNKLCVTLARYIEKHEPAPVDPDLELAREICAKVADQLCQINARKAYRSGSMDSTLGVQFTLSKLKERGK